MSVHSSLSVGLYTRVQALFDSMCKVHSVSKIFTSFKLCNRVDYKKIYICIFFYKAIEIKCTFDTYWYNFFSIFRMFWYYECFLIDRCFEQSSFNNLCKFLRWKNTIFFHFYSFKECYKTHFCSIERLRSRYMIYRTE